MNWVVLERGDDGPLPIGPLGDWAEAAIFAAARSRLTGLECEPAQLELPAGEAVRLALEARWLACPGCGGLELEEFGEGRLLLLDGARVWLSEFSETKEEPEDDLRCLGCGLLLTPDQLTPA